MDATEQPPGVLVVAPQRDLRRALFDALDREGHPLVHSARNPAHAEILLEGSAPLALVVMAFDGDARACQDSYTQLRGISGCADVPLIAVLAEDAVLRPTQLPGGVDDWLHAGQVERELGARWRRLRQTNRSPRGSHGSDVVPDGDFRFVFEEDDNEWVIVDPATERILEASPALVRHSGLGGRSVLDHPLEGVIAFEGVSARQILRAGDRRWHPCGRRSMQGFDSGEASARRVRHAGLEAVALVFRSDRAGVRPAVALTLLARIFAGTGEHADMTGVAQMLVDDLGLDYLAVWSALPEEASGPVQLVQCWRGDERPWPASQLQSSLRLVLDGKTLVHAANAQRLAEADPLVAALGLHGFVGLPLLDERRGVLGALLAGSRQAFAEPEIVEPVLRCAAAHFAHALELQRVREQGRAEGLLDALTGILHPAAQ